MDTVYYCSIYPISLFIQSYRLMQVICIYRCHGYSYYCPCLESLFAFLNALPSVISVMSRNLRLHFPRILLIVKRCGIYYVYNYKLGGVELIYMYIRLGHVHYMTTLKGNFNTCILKGEFQNMYIGKQGEFF